MLRSEFRREAARVSRELPLLVEGRLEDDAQRVLALVVVENDECPLLARLERRVTERRRLNHFREPPADRS